MNIISRSLSFCYRVMILYSYITIIFLFASYSDDTGDQFPIRYVSIKFNEVNARKGPTLNYPIEWVFIQKGEPVKVIYVYGQWRKVVDINNEGGWIHSSALSPKRFVIINTEEQVFLVKRPNNYAKAVAKLEPYLRCKLIKCKNKWCKIMYEKYTGWVQSSNLWGVYQDEL